MRNQQASQASGVAKCTACATEPATLNALALNNFPDNRLDANQHTLLRVTLTRRGIDCI